MRKPAQAADDRYRASPGDAELRNPAILDVAAQLTMRHMQPDALEADLQRSFADHEAIVAGLVDLLVLSRGRWGMAYDPRSSTPAPLGEIR